MQARPARRARASGRPRAGGVRGARRATRRRSPPCSRTREHRPTRRPRVASVHGPRTRPRDGEVRVALVGAGGFVRGDPLAEPASARTASASRRSSAAAARRAASLARSLNGARTGDRLARGGRGAGRRPRRHRHAPRHARRDRSRGAARRQGRLRREAARADARAEIDEVWAAGSDNDRLAIGFNRPFAPLARNASTRAARRAAGRSQLVYRVNAPLAPRSLAERPAEGGGRILGEACHMFDYANWLLRHAAAGPRRRGAGAAGGRLARKRVDHDSVR